MPYTPAATYGDSDTVFDLRSVKKDDIVVLAKNVRVYKKHNSTQIGLPVGIQEKDGSVAKLMFELKNVRMWKPSEKVSDSGEFRHYGTEFMLHEENEPDTSENMQRAKALERVGGTLADIMMDMSKAKEISVRKVEIDNLRGRFAKKTYIRDATGQTTDDVNEEKALKVQARFAGNRRKKTVEGKFYIRVGGNKVRAISMQEMLDDFPERPLAVHSVMLQMPEVLMCSLGYYPRFVIVLIVFEELTSSGTVIPKNMSLPAGFKLAEEEEQELGQVADFAESGTDEQGDF